MTQAIHSKKTLLAEKALAQGKHIISRHGSEERGVGLVEYALILAILVLALLASINGISQAVEKRGTISQEVNLGELGTKKYTMVPCDTLGTGFSLSEECY